MATESTQHPTLDLALNLDRDLDLDKDKHKDGDEGIVDRQPGLSVRLKLTLSYAGFLMVAGFLMLVAAWFAGRPAPGTSIAVILRYIPDDLISMLGRLVPGNKAYLLRAYAPTAAIALAFLLVFGLLGGWLLAGRMLAPLTRITDATRKAAVGAYARRR